MGGFHVKVSNKLLKFFIVITLPIWICGNYFSQSILLYERPTVAQFKKYESRLGSSVIIPDPKNKFLITEDYLPNSSRYNLLQPISFTRSQSWALPGCTVQYYFTGKDSLVKLVVYDVVKHSNNDSEKTKDKKLFEKLYAEVTHYLGHPLTGGHEPVVTDYGPPGVMSEHRIKWKKDNTNVELIMSWRKNYTVLWVRIKIYWL